MFNTMREAVEYAYEIYNNHLEWEPVPDAIYEKEGKYNAGTLAEYDHAVAYGWKYMGHPTDFREVV